MADAQTPNPARDAFELAYATKWKSSRRGVNSLAELTDELRSWRTGDTYGDDLPRLRFGWEAYQWALAAQAPAQPDRAVMQQALEALEALRAVRSNTLRNDPYLSGKSWGDADAAIAALEKSLAP